MLTTPNSPARGHSCPSQNRSLTGLTRLSLDVVAAMVPINGGTDVFERPI